MGVFFKKLGMQIVIWLFNLIDSIFGAFRTLAGIDTVRLADTDMTITEYFFSQSVVYQAFFGIIICSIAVLVVCMIVSIVRSIVNLHGGERKSHVKTVGQGVGSIFVTLSLAIVMIVGIGASDALLGTLYKAMLGDDPKTVGQTVFEVSVDSSYMTDSWNIQGLNNPYTFNDDGGLTQVNKPVVFYEYDGYMKDYDGYNSLFSWLVAATNKSPQLYSNDLPRFTNPTTGEDYAQEEIWTVVEIDDERHVFIGTENNAQYSYAYLGADNTFYALESKKLSPVMYSGWFPGASASQIDFATVTPDEIYGTFDTYTLFPPFEDEDDRESDGFIQIDSFNFIMAFLCGIIVLIALCSTMLGLVKRIYDLIMLFLALPLISATIPLDDGAKFKIWRETVISKVVLAYGSVFAVCVFIIIAPLIGTIEIAGVSAFTNKIFRMFLICGGALTISGGQLLFARLIGGSAEESREMAQSARTIAAGAGTVYGASKAAGRGLFGFRNANGKRVGGLIKGATGAVGAVGGGAVNAVGTALGGQAYRESKLGSRVSGVQSALRGFSQGEGWFSGQGSLGSSVGKGLSKAGNKFAGSNIGQNSGLNNGIGGAISSANLKRRAKAASYSSDMQGAPVSPAAWNNVPAQTFKADLPREDRSYTAPSAEAWKNAPNYADQIRKDKKE